jgi:23S rRNA (cytosine1962-C5)-methyltransferase
MLDNKLIMFENRLRKVYRILSKQAAREAVFCYRLYDRDLPEFPLIIDIYEQEVQVTEYRSNHHLSPEEYMEWLDKSLEVIKLVLGKTNETLHLKERKRKESRADQYQKSDNQQTFFEVREGELTFYVNLTDYLDTGLFIDHRITRNMVRKESSGKKVLNLFCYTGAFSVYAAAGGASTVVSVDLSNTYLAWAERNMELNGFLGDQYLFERADVLQFIEDVPNGSYDIIVLDPPTFSNSKSMMDIFDVQQDHVGLINQCLKKLTTATTPFDFKGKLQRWCYKITPRT